MEWMILPYKRYFDFAGRSQRKEYWMFLLLSLIVQLVLAGARNGGPSMGAALLGGIYGLVSIIPSLAVAIRRLHDTDRSGWWLLIGLIPLVGTLILIYFAVSDGTPGPNRFGEDPKGRGLATVFS